MENNLNSENSNLAKQIDDELDLKILFAFYLRNKFLIGIIVLISFLSALLGSLFLKKTWEGQFQIVLNSDQKSKLINLNPTLSNLINADANNSDNLKTQVGILESPFVLRPIYELVIENNDKDNLNQKSYKSWKSNLEIGLQKGTSILNISYRDKDKDIILPVLRKMSSAYQDYSGSTTKKEQELTKKYLIDQIKLYKEKSTQSLNAVQNFAIDQNLVYLGVNDYKSSSKLNRSAGSEINAADFNENFLGFSENIENTRVSAANQLKMINNLIKQINELGPLESEKLQYFGSSIPTLDQEGLPQRLNDIEIKLGLFRSRYTDDDPLIIRLEQDKESIAKLLKSSAIKYLQAEKLEAEARMEAANRPKGVLLKYRELRREAARDETTLLSLENDLRILKLEEAKISEPWKLITKPTLLKGYVAPSKKIYSIFGLVFGLLLGGLSAYYKEQKSDRISTFRELKKILTTPFLEKLNKNENLINSEQIIFLSEFLKYQKSKNIAFLTLEEINSSYLKKLREFLLNETNIKIDIRVITSQLSLEECTNSDFTLLFTSLDYASRDQMKNLKSRFKLLDINLKGFILLDE